MISFDPTGGSIEKTRKVGHPLIAGKGWACALIPNSTVCCGVDLTTKFVVFLFLAAAIASLVAFVRSWFLLAPHLEDLGEFGRLLQSRSFADLRQRVLIFPRHRPESGIRKWTELPPSATPREFLKLLRLADADFRLSIARTEALARSFGKCLGVLLLGSLILILHAVQLQSRTILSSYNILQFVPGLDWLCSGPWVALGVSIMWWNVTFRVSRRKRQWNHLLAVAEAVLADE